MQKVHLKLANWYLLSQGHERNWRINTSWYLYWIMYKSTYTSTYNKDCLWWKLLGKSWIGLSLGDCELYQVVFVLFHNNSSRSWPFINRSLGIWFVHMYFCWQQFIHGQGLLSLHVATSSSLSTYLKVMNINPTGRPNGHDNLFDFKGLSSCNHGSIRLHVKQKLTSQFQFSTKGLKFESQVSLL